MKLTRKLDLAVKIGASLSGPSGVVAAVALEADRINRKRKARAKLNAREIPAT